MHLRRPGAAVFLDRDGTLIRDVGYLQRITQIELLPRVPEALCLLHDQGFKLVMVTNQSAIARGWARAGGHPFGIERGIGTPGSMPGRSLLLSASPDGRCR